MIHPLSLLTLRKRIFLITTRLVPTVVTVSIVNYEWEFRFIKFKRVGFTNHVTIHDSRSIYALISMERECVDEVKKSS